MFIALEGIDGAGKSTLAPALCDRLRADGRDDVELWHRSDLTAEAGVVDVRVRALRDLIWAHHGGEPAVDGLGTPYHLFLHAAWFALQDRHRLRPLRSRPGAVGVIDGWFYRSVVKANIRDGIPLDWGLSVFAPVGVPDQVVLLDVDPDLAWERRDGEFRQWELGRWDGHTGPPRDAFRAYQREIAAGLRQLAARFCWLVVAPERSWSEQRVLDEVYDRLVGDSRVRTAEELTA
jgi:dTMP kinase